MSKIRKRISHSHVSEAVVSDIHGSTVIAKDSSLPNNTLVHEHDYIETQTQKTNRDSGTNGIVYCKSCGICFCDYCGKKLDNKTAAIHQKCDSNR
jgi:hypothetical protein